MKTIFFFLLSMTTLAQVGIGTTFPEATLHVADADGLTHGLQIEKVPLSTSDNYLVVETDGKVGMRPGQGGTNDFLTAVENIKVTSNNFIDEIVPTDGYYLNDNIALDLSLTVTVPAGKVGVVTIQYQVPIGIQNNDINVSTSMGVRFFVNGVEEQLGNSLFSISASTPGPNFQYWGRAVGFYHDWINNYSGTASIVRVYYLRGYVEQFYSSEPSTTYRFRGAAVLNSRKLQFY